MTSKEHLPKEFAAYLAAWVQQHYGGTERLQQACRYALESGGKRVRPLLVLLSNQACNGHRAAALPAALAIELVHTYSLVHDDLPACDNDAMRRGRPSLHMAFDETTALLCGDALLSDAFAVLAEWVAADLEPVCYLHMVHELATAAGSRGMVQGQLLDLLSAPANKTELELLHHLKTGRLLGAACALGAWSAGAGSERVTALRRCGEQIGLAFQIIDDLLDGDASSVRGPAKLSFAAPMLSALAAPRAAELTAAALDTLRGLGPAAQPLMDYVSELLGRNT